MATLEHPAGRGGDTLLGLLVDRAVVVHHDHPAARAIIAGLGKGYQYRTLDDWLVLTRTPLSWTAVFYSNRTDAAMARARTPSRKACHLIYVGGLMAHLGAQLVAELEAHLAQVGP